MCSSDLEVAKLAGIPAPVITRARQLLQELESEAASPKIVPAAPAEMQVSMLDAQSQQICEELRRVSVETLTPIEAMNLLYRLKQLL